MGIGHYFRPKPKMHKRSIAEKEKDAIHNQQEREREAKERSNKAFDDYLSGKTSKSEFNKTNRSIKRDYHS